MCKCAVPTQPSTSSTELQRCNRPPQGTGHHRAQGTTVHRQRRGFSTQELFLVVPTQAAPRQLFTGRGSLFFFQHTRQLPSANQGQQATQLPVCSHFPARLESLNSSTCSGSQESGVRRPRVQAVQAGRGRSRGSFEGGGRSSKTLPYSTVQYEGYIQYNRDDTQMADAYVDYCPFPPSTSLIKVKGAGRLVYGNRSRSTT